MYSLDNAQSQNSMKERAEYFKFTLQFAAAFMAFFIGFHSIISLVIFTREIMVVFMGNELCIGIVFFAFFLGIAAGGFAASKLIAHIKNKAFTLFAIQIIQAIALPIIIVLLRNMQLMSGIKSGLMIPFPMAVLNTLFYLAPYSMFYGFSFTLACSVFCENMHPEAVGIASLFVLNSFGFLLGGVVYTYYFVTNIPSIPIATYLALLSIISSVAFAFFMQRSKAKYIFLVSCFVVFVYIFIGAISGFQYFYEDSSARSRWKGLSSKTVLLQSFDTPYQNVTVTEEFGQFNVYGSGKYLFTFPEEYKSATDAHLFVNQHPHPEDILVLGGGFGGLVSEILSYPYTNVDYVELEPAVIELARKNTSPAIKKRFLSPRVNIRIVDGRHFIKKAPRKYDMVILDPVEPSSIMQNRYYTTNFYNQIKSILKSGGVLITHIPASSDCLGNEYAPFAKSLYKTFKMVFPYICISPGEETFLFGSGQAGSVSEDPRVLASRFANSKVKSEKFMASLFEFLFLKRKVSSVKKKLESKGSEVPFNTDLNPIAYKYNLLIWNKASDGFFDFFMGLARLKGYYFAIVFCVFLFLAICLQRKKSDRNKTRFLRFNTLYALFAAGTSGFGLQMLLIFMFQNFHGYIYQKIGLLLSLFMFGVVFGGILSRRYIERTPLSPEKTFFFMLYFVSGICFCVPLLHAHMCVCSPFEVNAILELEYYIMILFSALFVGIIFPLANYLLVSAHCTVEESTSVSGWWYYLGAAFTSMFVVVLSLPLLGFEKTSMILGGFPLTAGLLGLFWLLKYSDKKYNEDEG